MDGLLLDTEDIYTLCVNLILDKYSRPSLPWSIKAQLQGRPGPSANKIFLDWAQLPISSDEFAAENAALHQKLFPGTKPLPGVPELLTSLLKTNHLSDLFSVFPANRRVVGDDTRLTPGRGKPLPDIFLLALKTINDSLPEGEAPIKPEECLVFEDSVPGVEAGRRAGMRVIWCPHPMLKKEYAGREEEVLAGRTGEAGQVDLHQVGELGDGWAEYLVSLENFPYEKYGMVIPPVKA
ncbi:hypothetical protein TrVFT333_008164 [Trichoderma virens FT-333]|nr:hypothetical protein TrVFT333_008164 [Trichoderma virens FT-333]